MRYALTALLAIADRKLLISGQAQFQLVQMCVAPGIPLMAAVGAPSSLSVEPAWDTGFRWSEF
jgi:FdhD protein